MTFNKNYLFISLIVSFPVEVQKYFSVYKNFFIQSLKKNKIEIIYIVGKNNNILNLVLSHECFSQEKVGNVIYKNKLIKKCQDFK